MFKVFFMSSIKSLIWLILLPIFSLLVYIFGFHNSGAMIGSQDWLDIGELSILISMIVAIVLNFIFLMIIPTCFGGINPTIKRRQFYFGFYANLILSIIFPIIYWRIFRLDSLLDFAIIIGIHIVGYILVFILGALFVAPAYRRAFWFVDRN